MPPSFVLIRLHQDMSYPVQIYIILFCFNCLSPSIINQLGRDVGFWAFLSFFALKQLLLILKFIESKGMWYPDQINILSCVLRPPLQPWPDQSWSLFTAVRCFQNTQPYLFLRTRQVSFIVYLFVNFKWTICEIRTSIRKALVWPMGFWSDLRDLSQAVLALIALELTMTLECQR